tara:strand:- start:22542 stop:22937 length:396 start_codon:yes stop_codon:yes gene_type:complete
MKPFPEELDARISNRPKKSWFSKTETIATVQVDFGFNSELEGVGSIVALAGFESDGASVPRFLWSIFPPFGEYLEAAVIHDWLCVHKTVDSVTAANVFREAMVSLGVPMWKVRCMYSAVRVAGPRFKGPKV